MRKKLPPLNALRTFEAAARNGSFKHAAAELCVSHSAVSHQIKQLESRLGVELFVRKARSVELSKRGQEYYPVLRAAFDQIAEGTERIFTPDQPGIITVQSYSTFAIRWLIPRLPSFRERHPEVFVRLHTSQWDVDFEHEDIDVCVLIGDGCFRQRYFRFAAPHYLLMASHLIHRTISGIRRCCRCTLPRKTGEHGCTQTKLRTSTRTRDYSSTAMKWHGTQQCRAKALRWECSLLCHAILKPDCSSSLVPDAAFAPAATGTSFTGRKVPTWKNSRSSVPGCCRKLIRTTRCIRHPNKRTLGQSFRAR